MTWICQPFADLSAIDLHDMLQLRSKVFVVEQQAIYLDIDGKDPLSNHLLLKMADGQIVACCRLIPPGIACPEAMIGRVVVDPVWRGNGLAHDLMQQAVTCCQTLFADVSIRISAQKHLQYFYSRHGFAVCTVEYLEDGIPHVGMIREASQNPSASQRKLQARYLGHSAWLVITSARCLIFDYGLQPPRPTTGHLSDGILNLEELPSLPIYCFASHRHSDHYSASIHHDISSKTTAKFILGLDEQPDCAASQSVQPATSIVWPHRILRLDDMIIHCSGSTDSGVSFMIETPEAVIYHGGDLALWDNDDFFNRVYHQEIDWLARTGCRPDLAMLPVSTSDGYQEEPLLNGLWYFFDHFSPAGILPMHAHGFEQLYHDFAALAKNRGLDGVHVPHSPGDLIEINY